MGNAKINKRLLLLAGNRLIPFIGFVFTVVTFFPGFMSQDSVFQLLQSQTGQYGDWHPPVMAWIWSFFKAAQGPLPMLFIQASVFWLSLFFLNQYLVSLRSSFRNYAYLLGCLPWIVNFSGVIWKDVWLANILLLITCLILANPSRLRTISILLMLTFALSLRHNALVSVLPFIAYQFYQLLSQKEISRRKRLFFSSLLTALFCFASVLTIQTFEYKLLKTQETYPENGFMADDLFHASIKSNQSLLPDVPLVNIVECSTVLNGPQIYTAKISCLQKVVEWNKVSWNSRSLFPEWIEYVRNHPVDYLKFRSIAFSTYLRSPTETPFYYWHTGIVENPYGITQRDNLSTITVKKFVEYSVSLFPFFFAPYFWMLIELFLARLVITNRRKFAPIIPFVVASSLLNFSGLFVGVMGSDLRYIYVNQVLDSVVLLNVFLIRKQLRWKTKSKLFVTLFYLLVLTLLFLKQITGRV
jgi:hypothetical protein